MSLNAVRFFIVITVIMASGFSTAARSSGDMLLIEQWALESAGAQANNTDTANPAAEGEPRGTCASNPLIDGNTYSCDSYTPPATAGVDINVSAAWDLVSDTSDEVVIALIDTGIDYHHPDLQDKVWQNAGEMLMIDANGNGIDDGCEDGIDLDGNGYLDDCHGINTMVPRTLEGGLLNPAAGDPMDSGTGHGTNMAGVMGAVGNNADEFFHGGIVGVTGFHDNIRIATCAAADLQTDAYVTIPGLAGALSW